MCGIVGFVGPDATTRGAAWVEGALAALSHRGPDGRGMWVGDGVVLGHTRLSIRDPSEAGAQPMASASRRTMLSYNGEVYATGALERRL